MLHSTLSIGWRRPSGCLKLQVIFRKRATNYRALLRKMTCEDQASYDSTPLCSELTLEECTSRTWGCSVLQYVTVCCSVSQYAVAVPMAP